MYCRVQKLRRVGVRIRDGDTGTVREGILAVASAGAGLLARLIPPLAMAPIAELYGAHLIAIREGTLVLRGFERADQKAVLQEWACTPIDTRHGFDAGGRPLSAPPFPDHAAENDR